MLSRSEHCSPSSKKSTGWFFENYYFQFKLNTFHSNLNNFTLKRTFSCENRPIERQTLFNKSSMSRRWSMSRVWEVAARQPITTNQGTDRTCASLFSHQSTRFDWLAHSIRPDWLTPCHLSMLSTFATRIMYILSEEKLLYHRPE